MYVVKVDGQMIFSSALYDEEDKILEPDMNLETSSAGSFSFVLPPNHSKRDCIHKMKSIITVEQDGVQLFRGRAEDTELDIYNQLSVYCQGDKSFLNDSVHSPGDLSGKIHDFFRDIISNHNKQVNEEKRFTVGVIDAVEENAELTAASRQETRVYWPTSEMIKTSLLDVYGGYLRTRTVDGVHYIDWVKEYGETCSQPIEFSVNLLDLTKTDDAGDVFTVLIPLGYSKIEDNGNYSDPLTIESVNNGLNYIQDDEAIAKYGKIWRTQTWTYEEDPAKLLEKGRKYLKYGTELETLTIKAVDMHFVDGAIQPIRMGDMVRIISEPNGIDKTIICSRIKPDFNDPAKTEYTFGEPPKMLTDDFKETEEEVKRMGGGGGVTKKTDDLLTWAYDWRSEEEARYLITTGRMDDLGNEISSANIRLDGIEAEIELKVSKDGLISAINMSPEEIAISASKINLDGYVTASKLNAELSSITTQLSTSIVTSSLSAYEVRCQSLCLTDAYVGLKTIKYKDENGNTATMVAVVAS